jgi:hypothetical protein
VPSTRNRCAESGLFCHALALQAHRRVLGLWVSANGELPSSGHEFLFDRQPRCPWLQPEDRWFCVPAFRRVCLCQVGRSYLIFRNSRLFSLRVERPAIGYVGDCPRGDSPQLSPEDYWMTF